MKINCVLINRLNILLKPVKMILCFLIFLMISSSFMTYSISSASDTLSPSNHSSNGSIFSNGKFHCKTKPDCTKLFANSFCNYKICHCNFGYKFKFIGCLKMCQIDDDCYDDQNRLCVKGLCQCKDGFKQIGRNKFCAKGLDKRSKMNVMLVCLFAAISPLAIVVVGVFFKKISNCSLKNSQTDKISSNNFQLDENKNQNHHQNISINSPQNYDIESGSTSSFEYENEDSLKNHKI